MQFQQLYLYNDTTICFFERVCASEFLRKRAPKLPTGSESSLDELAYRVSGRRKKLDNARDEMS